MAITAVVLTSGADTAGGTSFTTASVTPGANRLIALCVGNTRASAPTTPTATGNGLTYVNELTVPFNTIASPQFKTTVFRAMGGAPSAGGITVDFGGVTQTGWWWGVVEFDGIDTSGTDGSGAWVQDASASTDGATSLSATLAAFGDAVNNVAFGLVGVGIAVAEDIVPGSGFTQLDEVGHSGPNHSGMAEWKTGEDLGVDASWTTSAAAAMIAVEIKAAAAGAATNPGWYRTSHGGWF